MADHSEFEEKFDDVPLQELHHLPVQPTGMTYHSTDSTHADRMNELMNRPAVPPPFPTRLPPRPPKQSPNKWMLLSILLLLTLIATISPLTTLVVLARSKASTAPTEIQTLTTTHLLPTTLHHTSTQTLTSTETNCFPIISYITHTSTVPAQATGIIAGGDEFDPAKCALVQQPLYLARNWCVMVKTCSEERLDVRENDCGGFCRDLLGGCGDGERSAQMEGCCGHCGCL